ncbi:MAG: zinc metalloprotease HtpX [Candidatus Hadarchaeales archaeon]
MGGTLRTAALMFTLTAMLMMIGFIAGYLTGIPITYTIGAFTLLASFMNLLIYWYADRWVLGIYRARLVSEDEEPKLHKIVENLASRAGLPKPKIAVVPVDVPNAFATGRSPSHSVVAVTNGAIRTLNDEELEGVLGHEIAHIKNRDMLINTLAAIMGAVITYVMYFSLFSDRRNRSDSGGLLMILGLFLIPFCAMLVRLSISRGREYWADETGAKITGKPIALANALKKIERATLASPLRSGNPSTASLFIVNPFRGLRLLSLFSTHPPTDLRIKRLESMGTAA